MRLILGALTALALTLAVPAGAVEVGEKDNGWSTVEELYLKRYEAAHKKGFDVGRNLLDCAWRQVECVSEKRVEASSATLDRWLNPPPEPAVETGSSEYSAPSTEYAAPTSYSAPSSGDGCPASMAPESGSAGYSAYNPSSGATGCYQIIPSTAAAHSCDLSTPGGQDECAARICATQGNAAWAASGAAPC